MYYPGGLNVRIRIFINRSGDVSKVKTEEMKKKGAQKEEGDDKRRKKLKRRGRKSFSKLLKLLKQPAVASFTSSVISLRIQFVLL